jgi:hypothetical protein
LPIVHERSHRALALRRRSEAADAVAAAERALAAIDTELSAVTSELAALAEKDRLPPPDRATAALLEADALDREARRARSRELAGRKRRLEEEARRGNADLAAATDELAQAIRQVELLGGAVR